jgi:hypothetical protein
VISLVVLLAACAVADASDAAAPKPTSKKGHMRALALKRERALLIRTLKSDPRAIRKASFMRRATAAALDLPLTVRLNPAIDSDPGAPGIQAATAPSDDTLEVDPGAGPAPVAPPFGQYGSTVQTVSLDGQFYLSALFSKDTVALGPSVLQLGVGNVSMTGTPFSLLDFEPSCSPSADPLLRTGPLTIGVAPPFAPGDRRGGALGWFTGQIALKVYTQFQFNSQRRGSFDSLGSFADDCLGEYHWTRKIASFSNPVVPLQLDGHFDISPALTTDGRVRLFTLNFDDAQTPQAVLPAVFHTCTDATTTLASAPAPTASCDGSSEDKPLSATVKVKKLTAEVLIGSVPPTL